MTLKEVIEILDNTDLEYEFLCEFDDAINISISIYREEDDDEDEAVIETCRGEVWDRTEEAKKWK